ncbi:MAG TPA: HD domain-containing phosphohydrolase [Gemmatimonadales bacterium]|nr:HD domain-containing phosphohydrolase [Gemmatimonadales bacterium]
MTDPTRFLTAFAKGVAGLHLYGDAHPAFRRAVAQAAEHLAELQAGDPRLEFNFLPSEVLFGQELLHELEDSEWAERMRGAGIERLEFTGPVGADELERFVTHVGARLSPRGSDTSETWQSGGGNIRWGRLEIRSDDAPRLVLEPPPTIATLTFGLREEREAVAWMHEEIQAGTALPLVEAEAVVRSLSFAMHADRAMVLPLLELKEFDQYTTTHSMNVSVLAMGLAEHLDLRGDVLRTIGLAALLHDLGKVCVPREILNKPGKLTDAERDVVRRHPVEGARMILERDEELDLAATVAYEHHRMINGGGYPCPHFPREAGYVSRLVHVCDVYDALRTRRPYREAWESVEALRYIQSREGIEFDPTIARAFVGMMRHWEERVHPTAAA